MAAQADPSSAPQSEVSAPLRAAVVGAGRIAEQHLHFLQTSDDAELHGICDVSRTLGSFMAQRYGARAFTDLTEMLASVRPDVLHVLTPPHLHVPMAKAALQAGAHVVVEKPMALDARGRDELLGEASASGRCLIEDHNYRFNRPMLRLQGAVAAGLLGDVTDLDVTIAMPMSEGNRYGDVNLPSPSHRLPAGFIHEFITHLAYLALAVAPELEVVDARWSKRLEHLPSPFDELDASLAGEHAVGRLRFTSVAPRAAITIRVAGTTGTAEAELITGSLRVERIRAVGAQLSPAVNAMVNGLGSVGRSVTFVTDRLLGRTAYEGLHTLLERTYRALRAGEPLPVDHLDMRRTGALVDRLIDTMP